MAVVDGREPEPGHAAEIAIACIGARLDRSIEETFAACDIRLRNRGGVSLAVAVIDTDSGRVTVASVGSVSAVLLIGTADVHLACTIGVVGGGYGRLKPTTRTFSSGDVLALYSDGLQEFFPLRDALAKTQATAGDQAGSLLERWADANADAAVLIYRHEAAALCQH